MTTMVAEISNLLTDLYQITMCYAYFKAKKHEESAVFEMFFRKNPFKGEFTIFAGLGDCLKFVSSFKFTKNDIEYLKKVLPVDTDDEFYDYLSSLDCSKIKLWSIPEGFVVFPRVPLLILEGPLAVCQMLESTLLNLVNYASLVTTNAARCRRASGENKELLEFGLRRAQGPNGALSASKYAYIGGFNATSNVLAGKLFQIPVSGTHAHSFVSAHLNDDLQIEKFLATKASGDHNFTFIALKMRRQVLETVTCDIVPAEVNDGEMAAFISYAVSFPNNFLALIDTYDVLRSGIVNFCACALALHDVGYRALGVRIDSGDLAHLSRQVRRIFIKIAAEFDVEYFGRLKIICSNDLNEDTIYSLNEQGHEIDSFAVGTHLVTCQKQPALGGVYKLVELNGAPRMKLGEDLNKVVIPGRKRCFRLYGKDGRAINDLMVLRENVIPVAGHLVLCRHPFLAAKRAIVAPTRVEELHKLYWDRGQILTEDCDIPLSSIRERVHNSLKTIREDIKRPLNPTPYKVSVSEGLYNFLHNLWQELAPIGRLE